MTPEDKAKSIYSDYYLMILEYGKDLSQEIIISILAKKSALISVQEILNCNPHTNQFNTDVYSTYDYWFKVKLEIEKL